MFTTKQKYTTTKLDIKSQLGSLLIWIVWDIRILRTPGHADSKDHQGGHQWEHQSSQ